MNKSSERQSVGGRMPKPLIAVDIDDVLVARVYPVMEFLKQRFGSSCNVANMTGESFFAFVCECFTDRATPEELSSIIGAYLTSSEYQVQKPIAGALLALGRLTESHRLWVLSTRPKSQHHLTQGWLDEHFGGVFEKIVLINEGHFGFNDTKGFSKASFCVEQGVGLLIDDRLAACAEMAEESLSAVLFGDYPWNRAQSLPHGVTRCADWPAVLEHFDGRNG